LTGVGVSGVGLVFPHTGLCRQVRKEVIHYRGTEKIDTGHVCEIQGARALVFSLSTPVWMQPLGGDLEGYPIRLLYFGSVTAELDPAMREPGVPAFEPTPSDIALTTLYQRA
jgi:hypothetical protein